MSSASNPSPVNLVRLEIRVEALSDGPGPWRRTLIHHHQQPRLGGGRVSPMSLGSQGLRVSDPGVSGWGSCLCLHVDRGWGTGTSTGSQAGEGELVGTAFQAQPSPNWVRGESWKSLLTGQAQERVPSTPLLQPRLLVEMEAGWILCHWSLRFVESWDKGVSLRDLASSLMWGGWRLGRSPGVLGWERGVLGPDPSQAGSRS